MKANELMIGDWVYSTFCDKPCKVVGVEQYGSGYANVKVTNVSDTKDINSLISIPLTKEILEKNGWKYNDEDAKFFPQTWVGGGLMLQGADDCGYRIVVTSDYDDEDTNNTPFVIIYVHELQHALRLRRIKKEIEL